MNEEMSVTLSVIHFIWHEQAAVRSLIRYTCDYDQAIPVQETGMGNLRWNEQQIISGVMSLGKAQQSTAPTITIKKLDCDADTTPKLRPTPSRRISSGSRVWDRLAA